MTVFLVGAGPGDPTLVTVRAVELLATADVVIHDRLVDRGVLALSSSGAELIDVGKRLGGQELSQDDINALLIERGRAGERVVRLKGGDPYVFGRGGEEAVALGAAGVPYEVVPGVSSLTGVPLGAGVPLTMRGLSSAVVLVTGHDPGAVDSTVAWEKLASSGATLVVAMGGAQRAALVHRLVDAGLSPSVPVVAIESGTLPTQRTIRTTLGELAAIELGSPATIVVGEVAALSLAGYEQRSLFGWRVVVTRAADQADGLARRLGELGAVPIEFPTIAIADAADGGAALEKAAGVASSYEWIVFSSENAVERFFAPLRDARQLGPARVAAIGSATAASLRRHGVLADLVPLRYLDEALLEAFPEPTSSRRVLLPRARDARAILPEGLRRLGYSVEVVEAYRTVRPEPDAAQLDALALADVVTFASSSAVEGYMALAGRARVPSVVASIGPIASATCRAEGLTVDVEAAEHTVAGLVDALVEYRRAQRETDRGATR